MIPETNSGTVSADWPTMLIVRSIGFPTLSAETIPPRIPSGTTMMNANIASFSERPSALVRIGPIARLVLVRLAREVRDPVPVLGQERLVDAELMVERVDRALRRQRPEDRAPRDRSGRTWPSTNTITLRSHSVISARPIRLRMNLTMVAADLAPHDL